jgi:predicted enzyme related to lactoylglutathione lyase
MPVRATSPAGAPCWADLQTSDTERSTAFYTGLFGWTAGEAAPEFGGYFMFMRDGVPVAGCMHSDDQAPVSDVWSVYLATDDVAKTLETAATHGGQVIVPAMPVGSSGTMGFVIDPSGAGIGLWQADDFHGFSVLAEPGAPAWFELMTRDFPAASAFYRDVFGWRTTVVGDTDEFRYSTLDDPAGSDGLAGMMDGSVVLPEGVPSYWSLYIAVEDADATAARAVDLGGSVVEPPTDTPYGRLGTLRDATGANIRIIAANEAMPAT